MKTVPRPNGSKKGLDRGFHFYEKNSNNEKELVYYKRLRDLNAFSKVQEREIRSTGYVVDTIEAAVWSFITTEDGPMSRFSAK